MDTAWITTSWSAAAMAALSVVGIYLALVLFTRLGGLRSFSKMSSFDFAVTVAIGSVVASTILAEDPPLLLGAVALGTLYVVQIGVARLRVASSMICDVVDNPPLLLMEHGEIDEAALRIGKVTEADLLAKLREANVLRFEEVRAVVLESTGDISVLHAGGGSDVTLEARLLEGVRRA